jgi:hypothetical protein
MRGPGLLTIAAVGLSLALSSAAMAQSALERLEKKLKAPPAAEAPRTNRGPAAARPVPNLDAPDDEQPAPADEAAPAQAAEPGYLGAITDDRQEDGRGVRVVEAVADGPAEAAGLRPGDLIVGIDEAPIRDMDDLGAIVQSAPAGTWLTLHVIRDDEPLDIDVRLAQRPPRQERPIRDFGRIGAGGERGAPTDDELPAPDLDGGFPEARSPDGGPRLAPPADERDARIAELEARVAELEQRLAAIEAALRGRD